MSYLDQLIKLYDKIVCFWEEPRTHRITSIILIIIFICALTGIELNREGLLHPELEEFMPKNHFRAISIAFTFILCIELIGLILSISQSLSVSVGKQLEIMALILLRNAFKELSFLPEPVNLTDNPEPLIYIGLLGLTSLGIFICIGFYHRMPKRKKYIHDHEELMKYIVAKKIIALLLLIVFIIISIKDLYVHLTTGINVAFFETVYTILIFADIFIVLVAQRFIPTFNAIFLHSASVVATLMMRLSLSAPHPWDSAAAMFSGLYILAVTWTATYFMDDKTNIC